MRIYSSKAQFEIILIMAIVACISACNNKSSKYNDTSLNLVEPVEIISWKSFADGGSIEFTFKDSRQRNLTLYYDLSGEGSKKNRHIYIGRKSKGLENSKEVPIGTTVEKEVIKYVSVWMTSHFPNYENEPEQIYRHSDGNLITSAAVIGLIKDLNERTQ